MQDSTQASGRGLGPVPDPAERLLSISASEPGKKVGETTVNSQEPKYPDTCPGAGRERRRMLSAVTDAHTLFSMLRKKREVLSKAELSLLLLWYFYLIVYFKRTKLSGEW